MLIALCFGAELEAQKEGQDQAQLIVNSGFEDLKRCPKDPGDIQLLKGWIPFGSVSPAIYSNCRTHPSLHENQREAASGEAFLGIRTWAKDNRRSYIIYDLGEALEAGTYYEIGLKWRLSKHASRADDGLAISFLERLPNPDLRLITANPQLASEHHRILDDLSWQSLHGVFQASGKERYILIGCPYPNRLLNQKTGPGYSAFSEYHIDDVYLKEAQKEEALLQGGNFEWTSQIPSARDQLPLAADWNQGEFWKKHPGTADLFSNRSRGKKSGVRNELGYEQAFEGHQFAGLNLYSQPGLETWEAREYLQVKLNKPLIRDQEYCLRFWISLADHSAYAVNALGAYLSADPKAPKNYIEGKSLNYPAQYQVPRVVRRHRGWSCFCWNFKAAGGEAYLSLGNFLTDGEFEIVPGPGAGNYAYYYLDQIQLFEAEDTCTCPPRISQEQIALYERADQSPEIDKQINEDGDGSSDPRPESFNWGKLELGDRFVLKNLYFEFDRDQIDLEESEDALQRLLDWLKRYPDSRIALHGHTDHLGSYQYNMKLSESRAQEVRNYLIEAGIDSLRLEASGFAYLFPLDDRMTEEARALNRRVEVMLIEDGKAP
jgi:outer membrane protein OmpA-like peptidoglycan-associated protein